MNEQKPPNAIEWTRIRNADGTIRRGWTWNPIAGCLHDCEWLIDGKHAECYAKTIAEKFTSAYKEGFAHYYWHPKRLDEPLKVKEPGGIFPDSMSDLFGHWVNPDHQHQIIEIMRRADWHIYQALTKNAVGYQRIENLPRNLWIGVSSPPDHMYKYELTDKQKIAYLRTALKVLQGYAKQGYITWMSFEPLSQDWSNVVAEHPGALKWAVIGAASDGNRYFPPVEQHVRNLLDVLDREGVQVFYKGNMHSLPYAAQHWREEFPLLDISPQSPVPDDGAGEGQVPPVTIMPPARKVAIVGSRKYPDLQAVIDYVNNLPANTIIVSGGAGGVDQAAEWAAKARGLKTEIYPVFAPKHVTREQYAALAHARNSKIVAAADEVVAFHFDGSAGTQDTINKARKAGKPLKVFTPDKAVDTFPAPSPSTERDLFGDKPVDEPLPEIAPEAYADRIAAEREYNEGLKARMRAGTPNRLPPQWKCFDAPSVPHQHGFIIDEAVQAKAKAHMDAYYGKRPASVSIVEGNVQYELLPIGATYTSIHSPHQTPSEINPEVNGYHRIHWKLTWSLDFVPREVKVNGEVVKDETGNPVEKRQWGRYYEVIKYEALSEEAFQVAVKAEEARRKNAA